MLVLVAGTVSCGGGEPPTQSNAEPHLTVIAGTGVTDTIQARLAQPLTVEFRDEHSQPVAGVPLSVEANAPIDSTRSVEHAVQVGPNNGSWFGDTVTVTTDRAGRAAIAIQLGTVAGSARVTVRGPRSAAVDAAFTVLAGTATRLAVPTPYLAIEVGATQPFAAAAVDRASNPSGAVSFAVDTTVATIDADGAVHGRAPGGATLTVAIGGIVGRYPLAVVPVARVLVTRMPVPSRTTIELVTMGLDERHVTSLIGPVGRMMENVVLNEIPATLARDGTLYFTQFDSATAAHLWVRTVAGAVRRLTPDSLGTMYENNPQLSPDGVWVYFLATTATTMSTIWRIHPDGTAGEQIGPSYPVVTLPTVLSHLSVDPNGSSLYVRQDDLQRGVVGRSLRFDLATRTLSTGLPASLSGIAYSPDRTRFAYEPAQGGVVVRTVATGEEKLLYSQVISFSFSGSPWSPDGNWIALQGGGGITLLNATTGHPIAIPGAWELSPAMWLP
ncbi:MAG TPA: Ig-like domain-containing protein [Gemmatimonadaceae bacterium]|nr:Ig-like domain-containing protein [Gemmatimonadaceae bacterium]